jgi:hypothetical protein
VPVFSFLNYLKLVYLHTSFFAHALTIANYSSFFALVCCYCWLPQAAAADPAVAIALSSHVVLDSTVRECDLLQAQMLLLEARSCWEAAQRNYPDNLVILVELGNLLSMVRYFLSVIVC